MNARNKIENHINQLLDSGLDYEEAEELAEKEYDDYVDMKIDERKERNQ